MTSWITNSSPSDLRTPVVAIGILRESVTRAPLAKKSLESIQIIENTLAGLVQATQKLPELSTVGSVATLKLFQSISSAIVNLELANLTESVTGCVLPVLRFSIEMDWSVDKVASSIIGLLKAFPKAITPSLTWFPQELVTMSLEALDRSNTSLFFRIVEILDCSDIQTWPDYCRTELWNAVTSYSFRLDDRSIVQHSSFLAKLAHFCGNQVTKRPNRKIHSNILVHDSAMIRLPILLEIFLANANPSVLTQEPTDIFLSTLADECTRYLIQSKLTTPTSTAKGTLNSIEKVLSDVLKAPSPLREHAGRVVALVTCLMRYTESVGIGSTQTLYHFPEPVSLFFAANRKVCLDWYNRVSSIVLNIALHHRFHDYVLFWGPLVLGKLIESSKPILVTKEFEKYLIAIDVSSCHVGKSLVWDGIAAEILAAPSPTDPVAASLLITYVTAVANRLHGRFEEATSAVSNVLAISEAVSANLRNRLLQILIECSTTPDQFQSLATQGRILSCDLHWPVIPTAPCLASWTDASTDHTRAKDRTQLCLSHLGEYIDAWRSMKPNGTSQRLQLLDKLATSSSLALLSQPESPLLEHICKFALKTVGTLILSGSADISIVIDASRSRPLELECSNRISDLFMRSMDRSGAIAYFSSRFLSQVKHGNLGSARIILEYSLPVSSRCIG